MNIEEKVENLIKAVDELKAKIGIKPTIKDYGIDEKDFSVEDILYHYTRKASVA